MAPHTTNSSPNTIPSDQIPLTKSLRIILILLCIIALAAAIRRIVVLITPPTAIPAMASLDAHFATHSTLTLIHIVPATIFVLLLPAWFSRRLTSNSLIHRRITYGLFLTGAITAVTALMLAKDPVGGINESAASLLFDSLFLFSLARAAWLFHRGNVPLHRNWMMRAIAVLLGIATTRPVMGVFFATQRLTHLQPEQFFGTAFWIGFTTTYIAGEAYLRTHTSRTLKFPS
jgi:Predicted membrane protein (DUF2306)